MKNFILINYDYKVSTIYNKNNTIYFYINNEKVYIMETNKSDKEIDYLANLSNNMYNKGIKVNTFLLNNSNKYYTKKDNVNIVLLKVNDYEEDISLNNLSKFENFNNDLHSVNILEEWKNEIDDLENELVSYNKEFPLIQKSVNYFIGCAENAIQLLGYYKEHILFNNNSIGHKVDYNLYNKCNINNPFTFIKINRMYDLSNYIKYMFLINKVDYEEIDTIIKDNNEYENAYLFACLLYPNTYISLVNSILKDREDEDKINLFINKIKDYRELLVYIQNMIKNVKQVELITWL